MKRCGLSVGLAILLGLWLATTAAAQSRTYHADPSKLPKIDPNKTFDVKSFDGMNKEFKCDSLEFQAAKLPDYRGKFDTIPLTEFQVPKADFYPKAVPTKQFEGKLETAVEPTPAAINAATPVAGTNSVMGTRQASVRSEPVEPKTLPPPPDLADEELKDLINQGTTAGRVRVGKGFQSKDLKPSEETPRVKGPRGTKSPPTSEPSR